MKRLCILLFVTVAISQANGQIDPELLRNPNKKDDSLKLNMDA